MYYDSTLLVTAEELAERKDVASIQSLDRVAVLIKPGVEENSGDLRNAGKIRPGTGGNIAFRRGTRR